MDGSPAQQADEVNPEASGYALYPSYILTLLPSLLHRQGAVQDGVPPLHGAGCARTEDVQVTRERARPH